MEWRVAFTDVALKSLKKLDRIAAALIISYIKKNLSGKINTRALGRSLVGNQKGKWRYRVGNYRLLCKLKD